MAACEVSVVIPTHNRWNLLSTRALRSALMQEDVEHEVIVVDDGSVDETPERLAEIDDPRVTVIRHEPGRGVARARNAGIDRARGTWVAFLDDDDSWSPRKLRAQLDAIAARQGDFAYAGVVSVDASGEVIHDYPVPAPETLRRDILASCVIPAGPSNVLARTDLVRSVGGFDAGLSHLADWDLWIRLAQAGRPVACDEVLVAYLEHLDGMSLFLPSAAFAELDFLARKHRALLLEQDAEIDRVAFAHYVAWLQLRRRKRARAARVYLRSGVENRRARDLLLAARFAFRAVVPIRRRPSQRPERRVPAPAWLPSDG